MNFYGPRMTLCDDTANLRAGIGTPDETYSCVRFELLHVRMGSVSSVTEISTR